MPLIVILLFSTLLIAEIMHRRDDLAVYLNRLITPGTASFGVRTVTYNGPYGPRNAGAIWVTDANNQFVKTIKIWASNYRYTLIRWIASSGQNTTGAITSASLNNHTLHNVQWDGRNWQNGEMPDGEYKFNIEFTEHNASAANMGKYKQISFVKSPEPVNLTIPNDTYFRDMSLTWEPVVLDGTILGVVRDENNSPIMGAMVSAGGQNVSSNSTGNYLISLAPGTYSLTCTATGYHPYSQDDIVVLPNTNTFVDISLAVVSNQDTHAIPGALILAPPYPNPTISTSKISFFSGNAASYELNIFNLRGQKVRNIRGNNSSGGWQDIVWDGKDDKHQSCPAGTYIIQLQSGNQSRIQKLNIIAQ